MIKVLNVEDIYNLYSSTFGLIKKDNKSWQGFIKMLLTEGLIDNTLYADLQQRGSFENVNFIAESMKVNTIPNVYRYLKESIEDDTDDDFDKNYELTELLNNVDTVIIEHDNNEYKYIKSYDKFGFIQWEYQNADNLEEDKTYMNVDDLINIIHRYTVKQHYNIKKNDNFLNIRKTDFTNADVDVEKLYNAFIKFYEEIFKRTPLDPKEFSKYMGYVFDSGLIDYITKDKIIIKHGENGNKAQDGIEGNETS